MSVDLVQEVLEDRLVPFEAGGVDVGQVVGNGGHVGVLRAQAGLADPKCWIHAAYSIPGGAIRRPVFAASGPPGQCVRSLLKGSATAVPLLRNSRWRWSLPSPAFRIAGKAADWKSSLPPHSRWSSQENPRPL